MLYAKTTLQMNTCNMVFKKAAWDFYPLGTNSAKTQLRYYKCHTLWTVTLWTDHHF